MDARKKREKTRRTCGVFELYSTIWLIIVPQTHRTKMAKTHHMLVLHSVCAIFHVSSGPREWLSKAYFSLPDGVWRVLPVGSQLRHRGYEKIEVHNAVPLPSLPARKAESGE